MEQIDIFDMMGEEGEKYKPIKSTDWKWTFADYPKEKNGLKVFSCFACGGGSTMGYKLAGCEVIGCCEIDPKMNEVYIKNHNPKHNFLMDIREFNKIPNEELPEELFNLNILDGADTLVRLGQKYSMFGHRIIDEDDIVPTILSGHRDIWLRNGNGISKGDMISSQTFPQDYDFGSDSYGNIEYICGMSVPPIMIKRIVTRLIESGVFKEE